MVPERKDWEGLVQQEYENLIGYYSDLLGMIFYFGAILAMLLIGLFMVYL